MAILGISGSPVKNSNTDRLVKHFLESTGEEYEFIKLSDYNIKPCRACLACAKTRTCVQKDDFKPFEDKLRNADAIVVGFYTPFAMVDAFTKTFLERTYPLHHNIEMQGKYVATIGSATAPMPLDGAHMGMASTFVMERMMHVGNINIQGSLPCAVCGQGNECPHGFLKMMYGPDATDGTHHCIAVETQPAWAEAEAMAKHMGNCIRGTEEFKPSELAQQIMAMFAQMQQG